jgi:hypothetical protein
MPTSEGSTPPTSIICNKEMFYFSVPRCKYASSRGTKCPGSKPQQTLFIEDVIVKLWREITRPAVETQMLAG